MSKFTNFDDLYNALPNDRKAKIQAKVRQLEQEISPIADGESQEVTITLPSNILAWLNKNRQQGQDLPTQVNHLLDEAILNHAMA
ncbi:MULTISPECIES: hypothetical protein [unclassified Moraxella]|uniref:hypothetical protein n=1 Tax=unclassified Moraxella TaxID=2685852 RepID=UPI003AF53D24